MRDTHCGGAALGHGEGHDARSVQGEAIGDVLPYLASGMSEEEILADFPSLTREDIRACLSYAAERERILWSTPAA